ncbi:MAG: T9SS type A sorting domain-containing protein [Winogradskyella sp.]
MKNTLIACLLLCFSAVSAQSDLFVSNGSYIYVDGTGFSSGPNVAPLFVTDDVNLETNSHIYLRNDAQLLQGNNVGNSGTGELSVYQNSEVNQFAYHYWCSPVGGISASTANNPFTVNQIDDPLYITATPIDSGDPTFLNVLNGTPNMTSTSPDLVISTKWLYTFEVSDEYSEWNPLTETSTINPGLGFTMKGMGPSGGTVNQIFDFRGKPNNGTITNPIASGQFTLIGNPYPSAIDAADFLWDPQNINLDEVSSPPAGTTGAIYYWEQDPANSNSHLIEDYVGGYASFTCTEPDGSDNVVISTVDAPYNFHLSDGSVAATPPAGTGSRQMGRYIPVGQGFMVEGATGIPGGSLVYLKNSHRNFIKESSTESYFFRGTTESGSNLDPISQYDENGNFIVPNDYKRFRVIISFNELYSRELLANFHDSATEGFDYGLEAKRPNELLSDAYWTQDDESFVIQAHAFDTELRIPLIIDIEEQQPLSFGIYDIQNFDDNQGIYIYDSNYDLYQDLRALNYHINIEPGNYTDRFEIVFTPSQSLSIDDFEASDLTIRQDNNIQQLSVINPNGLDVKAIEVFDVAGKRMLNQAYDSVSNRYKLSTVNLSDGVYVVNVTANSNTVKSEKIIIKH